MVLVSSDFGQAVLPPLQPGSCQNEKGNGRDVDHRGIVAADDVGYGHVTDYPSDRETVALQLPFRNGKIPSYCSPCGAYSLGEQVQTDRGSDGDELSVQICDSVTQAMLTREGYTTNCTARTCSLRPASR